METEGLRELVRAFDDVAQSMPHQLRQIVSRGAINIKRAWQDDLRRGSGGSPWQPALRSRAMAATVNYDLTRRGTSFEAEIGPDRSKGGKASLVHFAIFGGANGGGGRASDPRKFLEAEAPAFDEWLSKAMNGLL